MKPIESGAPSTDLGWDPHIKSTATVHSTNRAGSPQITSLHASDQKEHVYIYTHIILIYICCPR